MGCDESGNAPLPAPLDQVAGFSGLPSMQPGADCMSCHRAGGNASARVWTVAGTVARRRRRLPPPVTPGAGSGCPGGLEGVQVLLSDVNGQSLTLTTNAAGNFYTDQPLATLNTVMIQNGTRRMVMDLGLIGGGGAILANGVAPSDGSSDGGVSCNVCHSAAGPPPAFGRFGAPGSLFIPGN